MLDNYEAILGLSLNSLKPKTKTQPSQPRKIKEVHQLTQELVPADAISNYILDIRSYLRQKGYISKIYVKRRQFNLSKEAEIFSPTRINPNSALLYHYSIGSDITDFIITHRGPKALIYHNITPIEFFTNYNPEAALEAEKGRADLKVLAKHIPLSFGVSNYNADELKAAGFKHADVLPFIIDPDKFSAKANSDIMDKFQDGKTNILYVGRISPNKCQDELIRVFSRYLELDKNARLIIVGRILRDDLYYMKIVKTIEELNLGEEKVVLTGTVSDADLQSYYRVSNLYLSMSEHEGFGVPLIEAMWFDVPVLAFKSSAVAETLGNAGIIFTSKDDFIKIAALSKVLIHNKKLKEKVLTFQRARRDDFTPDKVFKKIDALLDRLSNRMLSPPDNN
ncbi:group 1 glycosyl transferase [Candidatus Magnetoovum chiemensis]|nr:group 1 glycosyl transferase [Candidatus Magnetoovum chiemensis]